MILYNEVRIFKHLLFISAIFVVVHFSFTVNFNYVFEWKADADIKAAITELKAKQNVSEKFNITLGISPEFDAGINFYRSTQIITSLNRPSSKQLLLNDYFLLTPDV